MPRIRTVKPEFWDSPDTARAGLRTRLLFIAMWNWADDYGIGDATPVRVIGFAFPYDEIPAAEYPRLLKDVADAYGVVFFEHDGRPYYVIPSWDSHQRTERKAKAKQPLMDAAKIAAAHTKFAVQKDDPEFPASASEIPTQSEGSSDASHGDSVLGTGEQGKGEEGKEEREPARASADTPAPDRASRGTRLPEDWEPSEDVVRQMRDEFPSVNLRNEHAKFVDYWRSEPGAKGRKVDWNATWRNWIRRTAEHSHPRGHPTPNGVTGLTAREQEYLKAELMKDNPDPEILRRAGIEPTTHQKALPGGHP